MYDNVIYKLLIHSLVSISWKFALVPASSSQLTIKIVGAANIAIWSHNAVCAMKAM